MQEQTLFRPEDRTPFLFESPRPRRLDAIVYGMKSVLGALAVKTPGIDVSKYQGPIDWGAVYASGIRFVIVKSTEHTTHIDPNYVSNWQGALSAGLVVGAYHFFRSNYGALTQAEFFLDVTADMRKATGHIPLMLDVETADGTTNSTRVSKVRTFLEHVKANDKLPGIYTSPYLWSTLMYVNGAPPSWSGDYWGWEAHWTPYEPADMPGWDMAKRKLWQIGISKTHSWVPAVGGITGAVDYDYFFGSEAELKSWSGYTASGWQSLMSMWANSVDTWARANGYTGPKPPL